MMMQGRAGQGIPFGCGLKLLIFTQDSLHIGYLIFYLGLSSLRNPTT